MATRLSKISLALLASWLFAEGEARRRGFVDRRRELQDLTMEEEVGQFGHEQTVILAHEKDSTTAKATSSVHVPHKDATTAEHQTSNVDVEQMSEEEIQASKDALKKANDKVSINKAPKNATATDDAPAEDGDGESATE